MAAAAAATTAASAPAAATAATPPNAPKPSTAGGSVAAAADTSAKRKLDADREDDAKKAKPTPNGAAASSSAAAPAAASPARAAAAPSPSPPSPTPPVPQLYNPNLFAYRAPGPVARQTPANTVIDYTSRKRTMESSVDSFLMPVTPTSSAPVNLCTLEQMCCDHIAAHLDKFAFLDAIPVPAMLKALSKASAEQLTKFEKANPVSAQQDEKAGTCELCARAALCSCLTLAALPFPLASSLLSASPRRDRVSVARSLQAHVSDTARRRHHVLYVEAVLPRRGALEAG